MKTLTIREVRQALSSLDQILAEAGEVTITRHGKPIARIVPITQTITIPSHQALRQSMPRMRQGSEVLVREERDQR